MLVAPVVEKGATSRRVYLPRGAWYDFWTEQRVEGGREIDRPVDLETIPLFVRAGAVMPFGPIKQYSDEPVDGPLTLVVYPGTDGTSALYEDDGRSFEHKRGMFMRLEMAWRNEAHASTVPRAWFADAAARFPHYQRTRRRRQPHAIGQVRGISADGAPLIGSRRTLIGQSGFRI